MSPTPSIEAAPATEPAASQEPESPRPTPTPNREAERVAQAKAVLEHWEDFLEGTGPDPIVFTSPLTRGGGWRGPDAGDQKIAFMSGCVRVVGELPSEPPPGEIEWRDGLKRTVQLISAESAVEHVGEHSDAAGCGGYRPLEVTGARLTTREIATTRGPAIAPVWQLLFTERDRPLQPITHVALDASEYVALEDWPELDRAPETEWAVGRSDSDLVTLAFIGSSPGDGPCSAEYTGEAVESDTGIVVVITGRSNQTSPRPTAPIVCPAVGYIRIVTVPLSKPLGNRTVLDLWSGRPVGLFPEIPEGYPRI